MIEVQKARIMVHINVTVIGHMPNGKFITDMYTHVHSTQATLTCQELTNDWETQITKWIMVMGCGKYEREARHHTGPVETYVCVCGRRVGGGGGKEGQSSPDRGSQSEGGE